MSTRRPGWCRRSDGRTDGPGRGGTTTGTELVIEDLADGDRTGRAAVLGITALGVVVTVFTVGIVGLLLGTGTDPLLLLVLGLLLSVFPVITFWALFRAVRDNRRLRLLGTARLTVPHPLTLGGTVTGRFVRAGGQAPAHGAAQLAACLVCLEEVSSGAGTTRRTVTHEVRRHQLASRVDHTPAALSAHVRITVPVDSPPSMALKNNAITWVVRVDVRVTGLPEATATFPVTVAPVVAADVGRGGTALR